MNNYDEIMKALLEALKNGGSSEEIPTGISNRHIHLSEKDLHSLFGEAYTLTKMKDLSQPGQFACKETVTICGPNGAIEKVRILGPTRSKTQIEILKGDCFKLGVQTEPRMSGELTGTPGITIIGPRGSVQTAEGLIVALRHIHMTLEDAARFDVKDGDVVSIEIDGPRGGVLRNVAVRANNASALECHLDTEEANGLGLNGNSKIKINK